MEIRKEKRASGPKKLVGRCHCGEVTFEASVDLGAGATRCNCSICTKLSWLGALLEPEAFRLLQGEESLSEYRWGAQISGRFFCKHCGVMCFGRGHLEEIGGDFVSINVSTLEGVEVGELEVVHWDGRHDNWQAGPRKEPWPIFRQEQEATEPELLAG